MDPNADDGGDVGGGGGGGASGTTRDDDLEARMTKKIASSQSQQQRAGGGGDGCGETTTTSGGGGRGPPSSRSATLDEFHRRIALKSQSSQRIADEGSVDSAVMGLMAQLAAEERSGSRTGTGGSSASSSLDDFEARLMRKSATMMGTGSGSNGSGVNHSGRDNRSGGRASPMVDDLEERVLRKSRGAAAPTTSTTDEGEGGKGPSSLDDFERRILRKSAGVGDNNRESSYGGSAVDDFEQRLLRKSGTASNGGGGSATAEFNKSMSSVHSDASFEARLRDKAARGANGKKEESSRSVQTDTFEARLREKAAASSRSLSTNDNTTNAHDEQLPVMDESAKRKAIQGVMKDASLTPQDRQARIAAIMRGEIPSAAEKPSDDSDDEDGPPVSLPSDDTADAPATAGTDESARRKAIQDVMRDESLTSQDRQARVAAIVRGDVPPAAEAEEDGTGGGGDEADAEPHDNRAVIRAKIMDKLRRRQEQLRMEMEEERRQQRQQNASGNYDGALEASVIGGDLQGHRPQNDGGPGVGYGSLPLPEEHFDPSAAPRDTLRDRGQDPEDPNFGLAVAAEVGDDEEVPDFIYNAIEYDPDAKPPLHKNRRFRVYSIFALAVVGVMVIVVTVYSTMLAKSPTINVDETLRNTTTVSPSASPTSNRWFSGIRRQIEEHILSSRNETFDEMALDDPRYLALDWILHEDELQLLSDDDNLLQRYALAVVAYSMDAPAWYHCGDRGPNSTEVECSYYDEYYSKRELTHGIWLSSTSECTWFGVTCSADGVVRQLDLTKNDLIGQLPYELHGLRFLQVLYLAGNCIYGTIPPEIGSMRNLLALELHENALSGEMPRSLYQLTKLQTLNLAQQWGNDLVCNRTDGTRVNIRYRMGGTDGLYEENAGLTGELGPEVGVWRSMKGLYLNKNSFEGTVSEEIRNLKYLLWLRLSDNFIEGSIPSTLTKLKNLKDLQLDENFLISTLPPDIGRLSDLEVLAFNGNSMYGEIPDGLYKLSRLQYLRLDDTLERQYPWLIVPDEGFSGTISTRIGQLKSLKVLFLSDNPLTGTIPTEIGLLDNLEKLHVHRTNLHGRMPFEICKLRDKNLNSEHNTAGVLYADCTAEKGTGIPHLQCDCCSDCCDHNTGVCVADD